MKIRRISEIEGTSKEVRCPRGGFISRRLLLASDNMGYSMSHTIVPVNGMQRWHYKHHLESCYCIQGHGILTDMATGEQHQILPGTLYILDKHDDHTFSALSETHLVCVFNPPLKGHELHREDGSYE